MASEDNTPVQINITGLITSVEYQKAKLCVERLHRHLPYLFSKPIIRGMLEFDWEEFIMKQRREYGDELWAIKEPVIITTDNGYIRGCDKFLKEIATFCGIKLLTETADYYRPMLLDYVDTLSKTKRIHVYMDFAIGKQPAGTIIFQGKWQFWVLSKQTEQADITAQNTSRELDAPFPIRILTHCLVKYHAALRSDWKNQCLVISYYLSIF